jgi:dTDP-D-glucose 4,6-dehydratase
MIRYVAGRLAHICAVNLNKLKRLGFRPGWSFENELAATKWYLENPDRWRPLKQDKYTVTL